MSKKDLRLYEYGGGWGDCIQFSGDYKGMRIVGWKSRVPKEGDLLKVPMQSGKSGIFRIVNVDRKMDPRDMFFADIENIGYEDESKVLKLLAKVKEDSSGFGLLA